MSEGVERTLAIKITPKLDIEALTKQIQEAVIKAMADIPGFKPPEVREDKKQREEKKQGENRRVVSDTNEGDDADVRVADDSTGQKGSGNSNKKLDTVKAIKSVGSVVKTGFNLAQQTFKGIFGIIQEVHNRIKQSSAFLATVENLFNLAMTLLFMPLGNALAEVILPSTMKLVESIVGLWDDFGMFAGDGDLKGMISLVMSEGLKLVGEYFRDIGNIFQDSGDTLLESIGDLFVWLGEFLESGRLARLLELMFNIFEKFAENIETWIKLIVAYQVAQLGATIGAAAWWTFGAGAIIGAGIGGAGGYLAADYVLNNADGGYYPQSSGGTLIRVAEQENEYVIPESKLNGLTSGGNNITNNFYGYTIEELKQTVREVLQEEVSNSQFRSGL